MGGKSFSSFVHLSGQVTYSGEDNQLIGSGMLAREMKIRRQECFLGQLTLQIFNVSNWSFSFS